MDINDPNLVPNGLELSDFPIKREGEKLIISVFEIYKAGKLYASQDWIKDKDIIEADKFNQGIQKGYYQRFPTIYWANLDGKIIFIVGDGHHRIADSILRGTPINAEIDIELKNLTKELITDPNKAQIKYAPFGLEGIWRFEEFIHNYKDRREILLPTDQND